jgi:hypothetical protein
MFGCRTAVRASLSLMALTGGKVLAESASHSEVRASRGGIKGRGHLREWMDVTSFPDSCLAGRDAAKHLQEHVQALTESPADFNAQLAAWLTVVNARRRRELGGAPADRIAADRQAMLAPPPVAPATGWRCQYNGARRLPPGLSSVALNHRLTRRQRTLMPR